MVETSQRFDKHIDTFVAVLVSSSSEEIQRVLGIKVVLAVEVTSDEVIDLDLRLLMQVLELVRCRELLDIESIGQNTVWFPLEQMLALVRCDVRDGCEDVGGVGRSSLDAISVVYTTLSSFRIHIEELQVVVEVDRTCAKISSEKCGVGGKNGRDINATLLAQRKRNTSQPFVELDNDSFSLFVVDEL